ncbi:hypothetical protein PM082_021535 [Marasmius tenuissimus]|nr:hypothetical protein PM082_021535 [Marasmius tenuissimus]
MLETREMYKTEVCLNKVSCHNSNTDERGPPPPSGRDVVSSRHFLPPKATISHLIYLPTSRLHLTPHAPFPASSPLQFFASSSPPSSKPSPNRKVSTSTCTILSDWRVLTIESSESKSITSACSFSKLEPLHIFRLIPRTSSTSQRLMDTTIIDIDGRTPALSFDAVSTYLWLTV